MNEEIDTEAQWEKKLRTLLSREGVNKNEYYMIRVDQYWFGLGITAQMMISSSLADHFFTLTLTGGHRVMVSVMNRNSSIYGTGSIDNCPPGEITLKSDKTPYGLAELRQMTRCKPEDVEYVKLLVQHLSKTGINSD